MAELHDEPGEKPVPDSEVTFFVGNTSHVTTLVGEHVARFALVESTLRKIVAHYFGFGLHVDDNEFEDFVLSRLNSSATQEVVRQIVQAMELQEFEWIPSAVDESRIRRNRLAHAVLSFVPTGKEELHPEEPRAAASVVLDRPADADREEQWKVAAMHKVVTTPGELVTAGKTVIARQQVQGRTRESLIAIDELVGWVGELHRLSDEVGRLLGTVRQVRVIEEGYLQRPRFVATDSGGYMADRDGKAQRGSQVDLTLDLDRREDFSSTPDPEVPTDDEVS